MTSAPRSPRMYGRSVCTACDCSSMAFCLRTGSRRLKRRATRPISQAPNAVSSGKQRLHNSRPPSHALKLPPSFRRADITCMHGTNNNVICGTRAVHLPLLAMRHPTCSIFLPLSNNVRCDGRVDCDSGAIPTLWRTRLRDPTWRAHILTVPRSAWLVTPPHSLYDYRSMIRFDRSIG
jgi:hypothetical protein